jgi:capsid protein
MPDSVDIRTACGQITVSAGNEVPLIWGYDAATSEGKRRPATGVLRSEDHELPPHERRKLVSQTREAHRNFVVAGWMLRKHLDYVSSFNFQGKFASKELNRLVERKMAWWNHRDNFDVARRHSRSSFIRLAECRATLDGDVGVYSLVGGRVQGIEGDRVRTPIGGLPTGVDPATVVHGVQTDDHGAAVQYCVCKRSRASDFAPSSQDFVFEKMIPARHLYLHGYFDRFDQTRGISPLASAINTLLDLYEGLDYALCKLKVAQLFALAFFRGDPSTIAEQNPDATDYTKLLLGKRPLVLDLDVGDRAEFLESKTPSSEFQTFTQLLIQLVLKALDIPYSFFNESFSNYSGSRQALLQYEQSAQIKRNNVRQLLDHLTAWRLRLWMAAGELPFIAEEEFSWEWVSTGLPWIDPLKEVQGDLAAIGGGLNSRTRVLKERGQDFEEIVDELAAENKLLAERGLPTNVSPDNALIRELAANAN